MKETTQSVEFEWPRRGDLIHIDDESDEIANGAVDVMAYSLFEYSLRIYFVIIKYGTNYYLKEMESNYMHLLDKSQRVLLGDECLCQWLEVNTY